MKEFKRNPTFLLPFVLVMLLIFSFYRPYLAENILNNVMEQSVAHSQKIEYENNKYFSYTTDRIHTIRSSSANYCLLTIISYSDLIVNGTTVNHHYELNVTCGSVLYVSTKEAYTGFGTEYTFDHWSDDHGFFSSELNITYIVPDANESTLIAWYLPQWNYDPFNKQYRITVAVGTVENVTDYYGAAHHIQLENGLLFVQFDKSQSYPLEILNATSTQLEELIVYGVLPKYTVSNRSYNLVVSGWTVSDNILYVTHAGEPYYIFQYVSDFEVYDISNVSNPKLIGYIPNFTDVGHWGEYLAVYDNFAFCFFSTSFYVVDVSDPTNPSVIVDHFEVPEEIGLETPKFVKIDNYGYVKGIYGIAILDISDINNIRVISVLHLGVNIYDIYIDNDRLYAFCGSDGVFIYDISDRENPSLLTSYSGTLKYALAGEAHGDLLFVADLSGVYILDVADVNNINLLSYRETLDPAQDVEVKDNILYVSCRLAGIQAYNISDPRNPSLISAFDYTKYFRIESEGYYPQLKLHLELSNETSTNKYYGNVNIASGDLHGRTIKAETQLEILPLMLYKDVNKDGIPTQNLTLSNYSKRYYFGYDFLDFRYLSASITDDVRVKLGTPMYRYKNGKTYLYLNFTLENISLVVQDPHAGWGGGFPYYYLDLESGSGKADITYGFWLLWEDRRVELKIDMKIRTYNLDFGSKIVDEFSIFSGFFLAVGYETLGGVHEIPINLTEANMGGQFFSILGIPLVKLNMSGEYRIIRDGEEVYRSSAIPSVMLQDMGELQYTNALAFGANFHHVKENDIIIYDPIIKTSKGFLSGPADIRSDAPDRDNDGLPDYWEEKYDLNPEDPSDATSDADNDGLSNLEEYIYHTDPTNPDSDNDQINDYAEINTYGTNPIDADSDDDMLKDGEEINTYGTDPLDFDTDDDEMPDGWEVQYGLDPKDSSDALGDLDNDDLTNKEEYFYGTDPTDKDTDNDGFSDGAEIASGTDPLDPLSKPGSGGIGWGIPDIGLTAVIAIPVLILVLLILKKRHR